jgi:hypothetical protein
MRLQEEKDEAELIGLYEKLSEKDFVMERDAKNTIERSLEMSKGKPEVVVKKIRDSYCGFAQMSHIVSEWLSLATHLMSTEKVTGKCLSYCYQYCGSCCCCCCCCWCCCCCFFASSLLSLSLSLLLLLLLLLLLIPSLSL